jgi:hypothetical protein
MFPDIKNTKVKMTTEHDRYESVQYVYLVQNADYCTESGEASVSIIVIFPHFSTKKNISHRNHSKIFAS